MTKRDELQRRYLASAHAVQAGVQMEMNDDPPSNSGSPVSPREQELEQALERAQHHHLARARSTRRHGLGCFVCGLPSSGAISVVCDRCLESDAPILDVCHGYPKENIRMSRESCDLAFDHDPARHEDDE